MTNFFGFNNMFPVNMNNWFMSDWSFPNFFASFQMPYPNIFNSWFNSFNCYPLNYQTNQPSLFSFNYSSYTPNSNFSDKSDNDLTDTFARSLTTNNTKIIRLDGYNAYKGEHLAKIALSRSVGWTGYCAAYVKRAIQSANLGMYQYGHAYQMPSILRNNSNFKEISPEGIDVAKLPAGCILVYDKKTEGYSENYGHTEITTGDGRAVSDGITKNLYKKPSNIFIPV